MLKKWKSAEPGFVGLKDYRANEKNGVANK